MKDKPKYAKPEMVPITIRMPRHEREILEEYSASLGRTSTDVLREIIRKLERPNAAI